MAGGLATTFQTLKDSLNEAAIPVLLCALDSRERPVQEAGLDALLQRHSPLAEDEMLRRWPALSARWKELIARRGDWIAAAVRKALRHSKNALFLNACDVVIATRDHDAIPLLVAAGEDRAHPHSERAIDAVLQLTEILYEELTSPRDYRIRRDPHLQRSYVTPCLERAIDTFHVHERYELIEAFCVLAQRDSAVLKRILQSPSERSYQPLNKVLSQSSRPGIVRLVLSFLDDPFAPLAALHCMAARRDVSFLRQLFRRIGGDSAAAIRANLKRIESVQWFKGSLAIFDALTEAEQQGAVQFAALSGIPRAQACDILAYALRHGHVNARRAAAAALATQEGPAANELAVKSLQDADPQVRANILVQIRSRGLPDGIPRLLAALDSPHDVERLAAQKSLEEFSFAKFAASFDTMAPDARHNTGQLVRKADPNALSELRTELEAPSRSRQRRALEIAVAMDSVVELQETILPMLSDEDQFLRVDVVRALTGVDTPEIKAALRQALVDRQPLVQQAAEQALAELSRASDPAEIASARTPGANASTSAAQPNRPNADTVSLGGSSTRTVSIADVPAPGTVAAEVSADEFSIDGEGEFDLQQAIASAMSTLEASRAAE